MTRRAAVDRCRAWAHRADARLLAIAKPLQRMAIGATMATMVGVSLPNVPRPYVDYSRVPLLSGIPQRETYGTDTIADAYEARVVLSDVGDMYTKAKTAQTPLEADTWSREASAPYPPATLLAEAGLYALGAWTGARFYGMVLALACLFVLLSATEFLRSRWYLFPLLYLNFSYFSYRFVYVQDGSYLLMLVAVMAALRLARTRRSASHLLMAVATTMKLSPFFYAKNMVDMKPRTAALYGAIVAAGLVLPYFVWDNYLYIYRFHSGIKSDWTSIASAAAVTLPVTLFIWYADVRLRFDQEDRIGWGLVPFSLFLALAMNAPRHLLIVLLVPDRHGVRNVAAALALGAHALFPEAIRFGALGPLAAALLLIGLGLRIDWAMAATDVRHPLRVARLLLARQPAQA